MSVNSEQNQENTMIPFPIAVFIISVGVVAEFVVWLTGIKELYSGLGLFLSALVIVAGTVIALINKEKIERNKGIQWGIIISIAILTLWASVRFLRPISVDGQVLDNSIDRIPITNIVLSLHHRDTGDIKEVRTNSDGVFRFSEVPSGEYVLRINESDEDGGNVPMGIDKIFSTQPDEHIIYLGSNPTPVPTDTPTPTPPDTVAPPDTPVPTDSPTGAPTNTLTRTPRPTDTPSPTRTPIPTRTSTSTPTMIPTESILYESDFENGFINGWSINGDWSVVDDGTGNMVLYIVAGGNPDIQLIGSRSWDNYAFEARFMSISQGVGYGNVQFRVRDQYNSTCPSYSLTVENDRLFLSKDRRGCSIDVIFGEMRFRPQIGTWYTMRIEASGNTISTFMNDNPLFQAEDDDLSNGDIAIHLYQYADTYFDDIRVWTLDGDN